MELGPVELVVLSFPGERADEGVVAAINDVASKGYATLLDVTFVSKSADGTVRVIDVDDGLGGVGLGALSVDARALVSDEDIDVIGEALPPGMSAAVIVYEESWARRVASAVRAAGGEVELHVQLPRDIVETAIAAAV